MLDVTVLAVGPSPNFQNWIEPEIGKGSSGCQESYRSIQPLTNQWKLQETFWTQDWFWVHNHQRRWSSSNDHIDCKNYGIRCLIKDTFWIYYKIPMGCFVCAVSLIARFKVILILESAKHLNLLILILFLVDVHITSMQSNTEMLPMRMFKRMMNNLLAKMLLSFKRWLECISKYFYEWIYNITLMNFICHKL